MKNSTPKQREAELEKAKVSHREWVRHNRCWDYNQLCEILPDPRSRMAMLKELLRRGFFVKNQPQDIEEAEDAGSSSAAAAAAAAAPPPPERFVQPAPGIEDCQRILRASKSDVLRICGDLEMNKEGPRTDKTLYRYFCEALLVFKHMQCPQAVEALTDEEWVNRTEQGERVVIGVQGERASSMRIALTKEEEAFLELYFVRIRPENLQPQTDCNNFFVSSDGKAVQSVSRDMNRLHELYKMAPYTSQCVRRAVEAAAKILPSQQKGALLHYLGLSAGVFQLQDVIDAALLLESLSSRSAYETSLETGGAAGGPRRDFMAFVNTFPVSLEGLPPSKKQRMEAGFPENRVFYDKWRASQYAQREKHLLSYYKLRKPSAAKVARLIAQEGWTVNCPRPEHIVQLWRPAPKKMVEADSFVIRCVSEQTWTGLAIKDFGPPEGLGVVATRPFFKEDIVCDYHGKVVTAAEGRAKVHSQFDEPGYVFFFKAGERELCIDSQTSPCECHPNMNTFGRRINHSRKMPNLKPIHCTMTINDQDQEVILFKATRDITVGTQLKYDYGVRRRSFQGEGLTLDWLDE
ncbi:unnamed protein product [Leuciscus chuanchicus]